MDFLGQEYNVGVYQSFLNQQENFSRTECFRVPRKEPSIDNSILGSFFYIQVYSEKLLF